MNLAMLSRESRYVEWPQLGGGATGEDRFGHQRRRDWREQYAVSKVTDRQRQAFNARWSDYRKMIPGIRPQPGPALDDRCVIN